MEGQKKITVADIINENAQIKADITTFISVVTDVFQSFGIKVDELGEGKDIMQLVSAVMPKLMMQLSTGNLNNDAFAKFKEVLPIIERYKHLALTNEH